MKNQTKYINVITWLLVSAGLTGCSAARNSMGFESNNFLNNIPNNNETVPKIGVDCGKQTYTDANLEPMTIFFEDESYDLNGLVGGFSDTDANLEPMTIFFEDESYDLNGLVGGFSDTDANLESMTSFLGGVGYHAGGLLGGAFVGCAGMISGGLYSRFNRTSIADGLGQGLTVGIKKGFDWGSWMGENLFCVLEQYSH